MKRYFIKYIRDGAKSGYDKSGKCYICGSEEGLDFHNFFSLSELVANWTKKLKLNITTEKEAFEYSDKFIEDHKQELFNDAVTLCHQHHQKLHSIYGRNPKLVTGPKQRRWVELQREKYGLV